VQDNFDSGWKAAQNLYSAKRLKWHLWPSSNFLTTILLCFVIKGTAGRKLYGYIYQYGIGWSVSNLFLLYPISKSFCSLTAKTAL
jgi:hypothetical protein